MSKTWGFLFGGSGHGSESSCQISAYFKFFSGLHVFCRNFYWTNITRRRSVHLITDQYKVGKQA